ncbi:MAG: hypothetical protein L0Y76_11870 [Ignavibacteria bacterium]|nr:hypothetical protein [Ignavibacteria bacterium]
MAKSNSKAKIFFSFIFVIGLLILGYFLLVDNFKMIFGDPVKVEEGKGVQYRFAYNVTGDKTHIIHLNKGPVLFEYYHEGEGSFYIDLKTNKDSLVKVLAQTNGTYEGKTELDVPETDAYVLTITTKGVWGLDFK